MSILTCMVVEKSLTKNFINKKGTEGRTEGTDGRDGRTGRCKPVYPHVFKAGYIKNTGKTEIWFLFS